MNAPLASRFTIAESLLSKSRKEDGSGHPGSSTHPAQRLACSAENSACHPLLTDRERSGSGLISPPASGWKAPRSICLALQVNTWNGSGRSQFAQASAASGTLHLDPRSRLSLPTGSRIPKYFLNKCISLRALVLSLAMVLQSRSPSRHFYAAPTKVSAGQTGSS